MKRENAKEAFNPKIWDRHYSPILSERNIQYRLVRERGSYVNYRIPNPLVIALYELPAGVQEWGYKEHRELERVAQQAECSPLYCRPTKSRSSF